MQLARSTLRSALALVTLAAVLVPAGGSALAVSKVGTVTGTWNATATFKGSHGTVVLKLVQHGSTVAGTLSSNGTIMKTHGTITGRHLVLHAEQKEGTSTTMYDIDVLVNSTFDKFSGTIDFTLMVRDHIARYEHGKLTGVRQR